MGNLKLRIWVDDQKILDKQIIFNTINFLNFYCQTNLQPSSSILCLEIIQEDPEEKVVRLGFIEIGFLLINNVSKVVVPLEDVGGFMGKENLSGSELEMSLVIASEENAIEKASKFYI